MVPIRDMILVILFGFILNCSGKNVDDPQRNEVAKAIINKIFNITSKAFKYANTDTKEELMKIIERKLTKSAEPFGARADKYIKFIMEGIKIMVKEQAQNHYFLQEAIDGITDLRKTKTKEAINETAKDLVENLLNFNDKPSNALENSDNIKLNNLGSIKHEVMNNDKQESTQLHDKYLEIKKYTDLISRGMENVMKNMNVKPMNRRMVMEFVHPKNDLYDHEHLDVKNEEHYNPFHKNFNENNIESTGSTGRPEGLTTPLSCDGAFEKTCAEIKSLNEFVCADNKLTIPLRELCNGVINCADGSDEGNCVNQAVFRLQRASILMSRVENYLLRNCFLADDNSLLIKQNTVLYDVLKKEMSFIDKYKDMDQNTLELTNAYTFKRTLNEVILVINTLALALDSSLCIRYMNERKAKSEARKVFTAFYEGDLDELNDKQVQRFPLNNCKCKESFCASPKCEEACKRVCWHKFNLGRWICQSAEDGTSVSMDDVCDGKLDCLDETDETGCRAGVSQGKFEANDIFAQVLTLINRKSSMTEYAVAKSKMVALGNVVIQLQKAAVDPKFNVSIIKKLRDRSYALINSTYEVILDKATDIKQLDDTHMWLMILSERLMLALKQTHTGNERIATPDGCYCRRDKCASTTCTSKCRRACAVSPKLTRYWCKATITNNISITLDAICNLEPNCPYEDDESQCSFDVCRKHHLLMLRHNIRDVGEKQKGTALGEALRTWKTKVITSLDEYNGTRPTRNFLRGFVDSMLRELVVIYSSMDDSRRTSGDYVLKEFYDLSQRIIEGLKACGR